MVNISMNGGRVVMRGSAVAIGSGCCCELPCGPENPSEPVVLVRTYCANPESWTQEIPPDPRPTPDWVTFLQETWYYYNISVVEEIPGAQYAWYASCCEYGHSAWIYLCGVPYYLPTCLLNIFP